MDKILEIFKIKKEDFKTYKGLFFALVILLLFFMGLLGFISIIDIKKVPMWIYIFFGFSLISIIVFWIIQRRIPRTPRLKLGIILAFEIHEKNVSEKFKNDLLRTIEIFSKETKASIHFHNYDNFHINKIIYKDKERIYVKKSKSRLLIKGRVRKDINFYKIDIFQLSYLMNIELAKEFTNIFPSNIKLEECIDVFDIAANDLEKLLRYFAILVYINDRNYLLAERLTDELLSQIIDEDNGLLNNIKKLAEKKMILIYINKFYINYLEWIKNPNIKSLNCMSEIMNKISKYDRVCDDDISNIKAIILFIKNRDVTNAIILLQQISIKWPVAILNIAFLEMYQGHIIKSVNKYKKSSKYDFDTKTIDTIEDFVNTIMKIEPQKKQLIICLIAINLYIKKDINTAKKYLNKYLEFTNSMENEKTETKDIIKKFINEISPTDISLLLDNDDLKTCYMNENAIN